MKGAYPPPRALTGWMVATCCCLLAWQAAGQEEDRLNPQDKRKYVGEPISLSLRDADLVETLRSFAQLGGFNLVLDPAVSGKVTVELKKVPWDQALEQILKVHGLGMDISGGQLLIDAPAAIAHRRADRQQQLEAIHTVRLDLEHANAAVVATCLKNKEAGILTAVGSAKAPAAGSTLVLRDRAARLLEIGRLLAKLDTPQAAKEDPSHLETRCRKLWAARQTL